jgi:GNAT superfamily N-acetyltransferase
LLLLLPLPFAFVFWLSSFAAGGGSAVAVVLAAIQKFSPIQLIMSEDDPMPITIRPAAQSDIPAMASIRAKQRETEAYWQRRISGYLDGELFPQQALAPRAAFVAADGEQVVGIAAGHLTRRYRCDAELQWIDTIEQRRRQGIAGALLRTMAHWFLEHNARKVCVDPGNIARAFYANYGARPLNQHWIVWDDVGILINSPQSPPFER